jgi:hypothetical protein
MARRRTSRRRGKNDIGNMSEDIQRAAISALRNAAKEVLNDLAQAGPNWKGEFRESWHVETADGERAASNKGADGKYNLFNIPLLGKQGRNARGQYTKPSLPSNIGRIELLIGNSSPYAQEAMDLIPGIFEASTPPKGRIVARGRRQRGIRGDIKRGKGNNRSTAPLHWYDTYMGGGAFNAAFKRGARAGFIRPVN